MRGPLLSVIVLGAGLLISCTPRVQPGVSSPALAGEEIRISRGPCFGFCPIYTVAVTPGGLVGFSGKRHTAVIGERARAAGPAGYEGLRKALAPLRPDTGTERALPCTLQATDMSQFTAEWVAADGTRTALTWNLGCRGKAATRLGRTVEEQLRQLGVDGWAAQKTWPGDTRG
ncbi:DUF6438 domain-containing protein [Novosphingobium resinovorum]|uniref:DUF6438 domain-containing protein n=1 Tax=Novosphingobium resinovorum TaxID=158500 RepID=UPI002ED6B5AD|nr:DUF6438 domain-containing protein [Novosphingobium resinovorum]